MTQKSHKIYLFSALTAFWVSATLTILLGVFFYATGQERYFIPLLFFFVFGFLLCFIIIQKRIDKNIYRPVNKLYSDMGTVGQPRRVTTDMAALSREVERFAETKKVELEELKIREEYRKEFIGNISHELKTPLFTVQGYILTLLDGAMKDKAVRKKYLQRAAKGVERLIYIVKDLDMITKLEVGDMSLVKERFNIIELVQNVFDLLEMRAAKKDISLVFDLDYSSSVFVEADKERIQQVLTNLVMNSLKYGREGGTTEVSVEELSRDQILLRVADNGEGISEENLGRIFERFFRVDKSGSRREGGSGLGLAIVKHIIEAHGQNVYVESQQDIGSEFSFTLEKAKK